MRVKAGAGGLEVGRPVAETCGPLKKIRDQICSILPCLLLEVGRPVAETCGGNLWPLIRR